MQRQNEQQITNFKIQNEQQIIQKKLKFNHDTFDNSRE